MIQDSDDEDIFVCQICDSEVDREEVNIHLKQCILSLKELYGEQAAIKTLVEQVEGEVNERDRSFKELYERVYNENRLSDLSVESSDEENGSMGPGNGKTIDYFKNLEKGIFQISSFQFEQEEFEDKDKIKASFLSYLDGVIEECKETQSGNKVSSDILNVETFIRLGVEQKE